MEEIKVGEYVRTNDGIIGKITDIDICEICEEETYIISLNYQGKILHQNNITKHSKNILDLIEVGDFVNGHKVFSIEQDGYINLEYKGSRFITLYGEGYIETIVTKEQFSSIEYRLED